MSDSSLRALVSRLASDQEFAAQLKSDPREILKEFDLTTVELFALTCGDADALSRLAGDTVGEVNGQHYRMAMLAAFDAEYAAEFQGDAAGGNTSKVTSQTVTVCCWP